METLDTIYNCKDYEIKVKLDSKGVSTIYDTPIDDNTNDILSVLHNIDGHVKGEIIISDGISEIREPLDMDIERFSELNGILVNVLDERNGWKRILNAFISTKLAPMNCNKDFTKEVYSVKLEEFLLSYDIGCFYLENDIRDYDYLGRRLVALEGLDIPVELENHIDYASYGHEWNGSYDEPKGIMTRFGYLYYSEYGSLL